jgi:N-glycosylase/DNA lyase
MNESRVNQVCNAISELGKNGIIAFDRHEPEYQTFTTLSNQEIGTEPHRALLGICAGTADYQLAGNAQTFWRELERSVLEHGSLNTREDIRAILDGFMEADVNARLKSQKEARLDKLFDRGFEAWFITNYGLHEPLEVWENLADALDNPMKRKTIVFAMKVYDIIHLIENDSYLDFPAEIPIPCDLQVERVARTSGITDSESEDEVMSAWAEVASQVSDELGRSISLLRIDSIVWQSGQIIGQHEPNQQASRRALTEHFEKVGIESEQANDLAEALTSEM